MRCPFPDQTTVPGLGCTGFLTAGFLTAGLICTGFLAAGVLIFGGASFLVAACFTTFLNAGFGARLVAGFTTARLFGAALPPENIAALGCGLTVTAVARPPAGTCHADAVATKTSDTIPVRSRAAEAVPRQRRASQSVRML
jgi:hypothetical protein